MPRVSICTPNLNRLRHLQERLDSIVNQTLTDWEWIIVDSSSDDGSWDFLVECANQESRMRISQAPREGIYPGLNRCIQRAQGDYIYIAPSDDVMALDCIEKLAIALEARPDCDIAHCSLHVIGNGAAGINQWWSQSSVFVRSSRALFNRPHVRRAPFDGLLHLYGETVYTSLTQLLIRRSLFDRIGLFDGHWGSIGDFHWGMRATLVANTVHVPGTWGGWRMHPDQATHAAGLGSEEHWVKVGEMINDALACSWEDIPETIRARLEKGGLYDRRSTSRGVRVSHRGHSSAGPDSTFTYISAWLSRRKDLVRSHVRVIEKWLKEAGCTEHIDPI